MKNPGAKYVFPKSLYKGLVGKSNNTLVIIAKHGSLKEIELIGGCINLHPYQLMDLMVIVITVYEWHKDSTHFIFTYLQDSARLTGQDRERRQKEAERKRNKKRGRERERVGVKERGRGRERRWVERERERKRIFISASHTRQQQLLRHMIRLKSGDRYSFWVST